MKLSIITPCSRPNNLPIIYSSISKMEEFTDIDIDIEWIIVYDSDMIDKRILQYDENDNIKLILTNYKKQLNEPHAGFIRNKGLEFVNGEYIYYLDDDTIIHERFYHKLKYYATGENIIIFNQFSEGLKTRINKFDINKLKPMHIDTNQFVIPIKYKYVKWSSEELYYEEYPYLRDVIKECGEEKIKWVDRCYSFRNYLRKT